MIPSPLYMTGSLRQSDVGDLQRKTRDQIDQGGIQLLNDGLTELESGPLQVFLAAAKEARSRDLPCELEASAKHVFNTTLAKMSLADADSYFTIISDRQALISK
jgi:hypothetical protein